ncbi:hypothetical protein [Lysinibacillus xylanilyticus]|uniref:hypothetical protein n=1 Tax=Lysinibacillus xylanilyticus TaxID=582475 RepID=UPI00083C9873|nr:hypothetical protein [Lysinibacillus xylanilyticus]
MKYEHTLNEVEDIPIRMGKTGATARSRAIRELRTSNRQFEEMAAAEDSSRLKLEKTQLAIILSQLAKSPKHHTKHLFVLSSPRASCSVKIKNNIKFDVDE